MCVCVCTGTHARSLQLCLTLCNPMDCSLPGSSVRGILQARILGWVAIPFSRESSQTREWTWVSLFAGRFFTIWATREAHMYVYIYIFLFVFFSIIVHLGYWMYFHVLYSRTLFIHPVYNSLHLLIPNSQSIPPSPLPVLATTSLFSMSVTLFLFCR